MTVREVPVSITTARTSSSVRWGMIVGALFVLPALVIASVAAVKTRAGDSSINTLDLAMSHAPQRPEWTIQISASPVTDSFDQRSVSVHLTDRQGAPVSGAVVELSAFHHALPSEVNTACMQEDAPGEYELLLPIQQRGFWEFEVSASTKDRSQSTKVIQFVESPNPL